MAKGVYLRIHILRGRSRGYTRMRTYEVKRPAARRHPSQFSNITAKFSPRFSLKNVRCRAVLPTHYVFGCVL